MAQFRKILLQCMMLTPVFTTNAQNNLSSPEVTQMYLHAQENIMRGNYKDAIVIYKQAIVLAPDRLILYKGLGKAFYLSGNYKKAVQTLQPLIEKPEADEECYDLLAESQAAQNNIKSAEGVLKKGLSRFPASGLLYHEAGNVFELGKKPDAALHVWVEGIHKDPAYPQNYYNAANAYMGGKDVMLGLLYGEIYLNIVSDTTGEAGFKRMLFAAYKTMFDNIATGNTTEFGKTEEQSPAISFIDAVQQTYRSLTPVVSDGITTENLTMVRTRFIMDWFERYANKYPFSLFTYQDYLIRNGLFDIYNEWLFGKAESFVEYNAWNQFHPGEMNIFLEKKRGHSLTPITTDVYNDQGMDGMIRKMKR